jgi:hypothetical protein
MDTMIERGLADWVMGNAEAGKKRLYFTINGDVPLTDGEGSAVYYQIPHQGKLVCVLHPEHLTRVAQLCYECGVQMIQVLM